MVKVGTKKNLWIKAKIITNIFFFDNQNNNKYKI